MLQIDKIVFIFNKEGKSLCQRMWQVRTGKPIPQEQMLTEVVFRQDALWNLVFGTLRPSTSHSCHYSKPAQLYVKAPPFQEQLLSTRIL